MLRSKFNEWMQLTIFWGFYHFLLCTEAFSGFWHSSYFHSLILSVLNNIQPTGLLQLASSSACLRSIVLPSNCELGSIQTLRTMTVDDENSVYVGGLPYDSTEDSLRRALEVYGTIIAVKIVNDREFGGKCYGFVTFTNPRSAVNAINDMDGRTIGGRVVRVNEVRSKSSRSAFGRDNFFRDRYRDQDRGRDRDRERQRERDRDRDAERDRDRDRDLRFRNRIGAARHVSPLRNQKLSPRTFHTAHRRSLQRQKSHSPRGQSPSGSSSDGKRHASLSPSPRKSERIQLDENSGRHKLTIISNDRDLSKVREELDKAIQSRDELKHEVVRLEEESDNKRLSISELQKKSQRLEESLAVARMASFQRKMHLRKLQKCFLQVKDYSEKLKSSEQELQSLVDASVLEMNGLDDGAGED